MQKTIKKKRKPLPARVLDMCLLFNLGIVYNFNWAGLRKRYTVIMLIC